MTADEPLPPTDDAQTVEPDSGRGLLVGFGVLVATIVAALLWLAVRADSPEYIRGALDVFFHGLAGAAVVYFAFRALLRYPFHFVDLLTIVVVLSLGLKTALDVQMDLFAVGLIRQEDVAVRYGQMFHICLLCASVLLAGAALGLNFCRSLRIARTLSRCLLIVCAMLVLPTAAACVGFPLLIVQELLNALRPTLILTFMVKWLVALVVTGVNANCGIRVWTLRAEVDAKEKMP